MEQGKRAQNRSSLLNYAITRLDPEAFSHPVWSRFGDKESSASLNIIKDLLSTVESLERDDPSTACQVWLICAVYQNRAGQKYDALRSSQHALILSQGNNLSKETIWALWGTCAILIQQGNHEQACSHLLDLQAALHEQNDWVLAGFVDVFRQAFSQDDGIRARDRAQSLRDTTVEDTLGFTLNWLLHWGHFVHRFETEPDADPDRPPPPNAIRPEAIQSFFSRQHLQRRWESLMSAIRGKLRRQGTEADFSANSPAPINNSLPITGLSKKKASTATSNVSTGYSTEQETTFIPVAVHMLGSFCMTIGDLTIKLPASRGLSLLKYLLVHRKQHITREMLMDIFWPDAEPETARNNLNVAMHSLRKSLRNTIFLPVILYQEGGYIFDPNLQIWLDVEEFVRCVQEGQRLEARNQTTAAITEYEAAISLYQGDFLEQNPYEEWTILDRERLRIAYLDTLDRLSQIYCKQEQYAACIAVCQLILTYDRCREDAHCLLMRCYSSQGQHHLALRQYQMCVEVLRAELEVEPSPQTLQLYEQIRREHH